MSPQALQAAAREIVLDETDNDQVRAAALTAVTHFGDEKAVANDQDLYEQVDKLHSESPSEPLKQGARQFLSKYQR